MSVPQFITPAPIMDRWTRSMTGFLNTHSAFDRREDLFRPHERCVNGVLHRKGYW